MMLKNIEFFALRLEELGLIVPDLRLNLRDRLRAYYKKHPKAMEPQPKDRQTPVLFFAPGEGDIKKKRLPKESFDRKTGDLNKFYLNP